ncbi:MAG: hypothetical protein LBG10_09055, partial [Treponema sp.]|nr:hypothetical protein [Treponema sp.]
CRKDDVFWLCPAAEMLIDAAAEKIGPHSQGKGRTHLSGAKTKAVCQKVNKAKGKYAVGKAV